MCNNWGAWKIEVNSKTHIFIVFIINGYQKSMYKTKKQHFERDDKLFQIMKKDIARMIIC